MNKSLVFLVTIILAVTGGTVRLTAAEPKPEIFVQLGHSDWVSSVAFSPDGKYASQQNLLFLLKTNQ